MSLIEQLRALPSNWGYVAVGHNKRPYQAKWQENPLTPEQLKVEIEAGRAHAIGVIAGPASGGLLFIDHDGISAEEVLESLGIPRRALPKSWAVTSGRAGRFQIIYKVPSQYWSQIKTRKIKSGKSDEDGNAEQVEFRWSGCQSIVAGSHPITGSYRWLKDRSPTDLPLAEAPLKVIELMLPKQPEPVQSPIPRAPTRYERTDREWAIIWLDALSISRASDYDQWIAVGMALHSIGDDSLLNVWDGWSALSPKYEPGLCEEKWRTFKAGNGYSIASLANMAKEDGWKSSAKNATVLIESNGKTTVQSGFKESKTKLNRIEAHDLLAMLRPERGQPPEFRYNLFTQQVETNSRPIEGLERYYLQFAEQGWKVSKEMAIDAIVEVAKENPYDPVAEYLENMALNIEPAYIDRIASTYLRPEDGAKHEPTLYDHMIKTTLIGAVRRVFEPGCKHDTACVLMGDQGARKSSFWAALGGPYFSDALRDISSKDDLMVLHRSWLMEWAELDHVTNKRHAGQVKAFLSQATDMFRVPYGKATEAFPRRSIIVGSTNRESGFLVDETGNRRFLVIPVTCTLQKPIDVTSLLLERDAIWSAAVHAYRSGESNYLTFEQEACVAAENTNYLIDSPWVEPIQEWLHAPQNRLKPITAALLLEEAIQKPVERQTRFDQMQVGTILRDLGYTRKRVRVDGIARWCYVPT